MSPADVIAWFEEIAQRQIKFVPASGPHMFPHYDLSESARWFTDAQSALESVFPADHAVLKRWYATVEPLKAGSSGGMSATSIVKTGKAIVESALDQLKRGRLKTVVHAVQAETVGELLDQAETLLAKNYVVAATVIAGGALETHLRHLCQQHGITTPGDGSIEKYNNAVGQHRKQTGHEVYSVSDGKLVTAWGGKRNDAAHDPANFAHSRDEVRLMIEGILQFIAKTS